MPTCALLLACFGIVGCGGSSEPATTQPPPPTNSGDETPPPEQDDGPQIQGIMGTISAMAINDTMSGRMQQFLGCFQDRWSAVRLLGGHIELAFRIARDGTVRWVYPRASTIGDRETEQCILGIAQRIHFPRPHGGEAEFGYPFDVDPPDDIRPPLNWDADHVADVVDAKGGDVIQSCGGGSTPYQVTVYIARGGHVMASGAAVNDHDEADGLDCVASAVLQWDMPDPGSYPAKVTFQLQ